MFRGCQIVKVQILDPLPPIKRVNGEITYRDAIKEAVREKYSQAALRAGGSCCGGRCSTRWSRPRRSCC